MDKSLDEVIADRQRNMNRGSGRRGPRRNDWPRDGVRKSAKDDRQDPDHWVHDRYDGDRDTRRGNRDYPTSTRRQDDHQEANDSAGAKIRVDNLHYDLTEEDLEDLFTRIGPVTQLSLRYDRAGRSEGTAYVTYSRISDARSAIREYDGANAKGQPIRLTLLPTGPAATRNALPSGRNPFDTARMPAKSLFERISAPAGRSNSPTSDESPSDDNAGGRARRGGGRGARRSPGIRHSDVSKPPPDNIDRYVPGERGPRSRSPPRRPRDGGGRRAGERREDSRRGGRREGGGDGRRMINGRPRKTQEELDKDMDDYWGGGAAGVDTAEANGAETSAGFGAPAGSFGQAAAPEIKLDDDVDMIE